ncbi:MAG TPA: 30S ribosomal protein S12 methylthiotransferase RimO [Planctomycetaceae bacterium]|nr:30S ribosomal protein S12 methylthiotransferase RimO [Planctomycetaceae bacterium]
MERPELSQVKGTYAFVSLGCPKNLVDSERMLGLLQLDGYRLVAEPAGADFVVVNTCGFIENAREESFASIDAMLDLKRSGQTRGVIVTGCLAERQKEQLLDDRPEIDSLVGVFSRDEITLVADRLLGNQQEQRTVFQPAPLRALSDQDRYRITPRHFAYLKISEGCDRLCTFCAIPKMRGKHASKTIEDVLTEAGQLAASGARELIIVAQDTTYYGIDLYGKPRLKELLEQLEEIDGIEWIRLMYFYPMYIDDALIQVLARSKKILPYIDIPLQHADDAMLRRMARRVTHSETEDLLSRLRAGIPGLALRTTMITGFPGETDEQFEFMQEFVRNQRFERLGVFTYSLETDTPAAKLLDHVDEQVMLDRQSSLMRLQQEHAFAFAESQIGTTMDVLIDQSVEGEQNVWLGRSFADAPDVDARVFVTGADQQIIAGQFVSCEIVASQGYDLIAFAVANGR